jgi:hypothetical protein
LSSVNGPSGLFKKSSSKLILTPSQKAAGCQNMSKSAAGKPLV